MKKFISALSAFVITATALGGTFAVSTTAATNGTVDKTIIDFQSNGKNEIEAKAGDSIPVSIYVPQSNGFQQLSLKLSINGGETIGQDPSECGGATNYTLKKDTKLGKAGDTIVHPELFGNYGITMTNGSFTDPNALNSGYANFEDQDFDVEFQGNSAAGLYDKMCTFSTESYNILYQAPQLLTKMGYDMDSNAAYQALSGKEDYSGYSERITTWTADESWAYDMTMATCTLNLPKDLPDGVYVLDVYTGDYVNYNFLEDFNATTGELPRTKSEVKGVDGEKAFGSNPLTIKVGDIKETTTTASSTTTSKTTTSTTGSTGTSSSATTASTASEEGDITVLSSDIVYDLTVKDGANTFNEATGRNEARVDASTKYTILWTVKNDPGTAGMEFHLDVSQVTYGKMVGISPAYKAEIQTQETDGVVSMVWAGSENLTADDGAIVTQFQITTPAEDGEYVIDLAAGEKQNVAPRTELTKYSYTFHGLTLIIGEAPETTTTASVTTTTESTTASTSSSTSTSSTTTTSTTKKTTESSGSGDDLTPFYGDTNCDDKVSIADVVLLNKSLAKNATLSKQGELNADCVKDDAVKTNDSKVIKGYLAKLIEYSVLGTADAEKTLDAAIAAQQ